ncbi:ornithine cyclodeaminase family protein [Pandoraea sp. ISTKB]|uniref:ornithine cyclodeaminase family protein n=1 Tax=Pandoraea sp. ISTKB TaxID=1586708 RepID=UPI0008471FC7|nr:ornithine cyclodeaminase family protein [Pandoraea sp. ISTKB]ODP32699.1 ornithine cyclodeaminase [Pandoraea sp. ISTKB]
MLHITDELVDAHVTAADAQTTLRESFLAFGRGDAAMQARVRTEANGVKLSTLGAVIPTQDVVGAKVYTTISGQFSFVIVLFSARDGKPLAVLDANAITRLRTAACSVIAAKQFAIPGSATLALFGAGIQGRQHAVQLSRAFPIEQILLHDPYVSADAIAELANACDVPVHVSAPQPAVEQADIVVTASRSQTPLFDGAWLKPNAFVAAIGSSLPTTRELNDVALARASRVVVEWKPQATSEAGDIILAAKAVLPDEKLIELADALAMPADAPPPGHHGIVVYKSVGVGLEDIAIAGLAYLRVTESAGMSTRALLQETVHAPR